MKKIISSMCMIGCLSIASDGIAGDAEAGKARAVVCGTCHGADGKTVRPGFPKLAGQDKIYLASALKAYKNKQRAGGLAVVMQGQATSLTPEEIENLAEYYSSLKP